MLEAEMASSLAHLGAAGLMGYMWLSERRDAAQRERKLGESHARLMQEREKLDVLVAALNDNTRALTAVESGQSRMASLIERVMGVGEAASPKAA